MERSGRSEIAEGCLDPFQGAEDPIVRTKVTARDVERRCEAGEVVDLRVIRASVTSR